MVRHLPGLLPLSLAAFLAGAAAPAAEPLHARIDALILAKADGRPASPAADDAEFLRRVYLDLAGRVPSAEEARAFLRDTTPDRRARLIDQLLAGPDYPRHMQETFHILLMERRGDNEEWARYLRASFEANKPWDEMAREILDPLPLTGAARGAAFFYAKRLEHYGQNPVDYPGLTRDVGRLFLGVDLRCAQCHDHVFIKDYKQHDFQGLFAFFQNCFLQDGTAALAEKPTLQKIGFTSVLSKAKGETGPRLPGLPEVAIPGFKKGEEYAEPPDPKKQFPGRPRFSPLAELAQRLPSADNPAFARNMANRLWFLMMGRGLVHPLDLHHRANPPSHSELLDLLAKEFAGHRFDIKWLLRELALSQTYQRSGTVPAGSQAPPPESFLVANEKRLSAEQLLWSMLEVTGEKRVAAGNVEPLRAKFVKAFANPAGEAEDAFTPELRGALFLLNDDTVLGWLSSRDGNLVDRLAKLPDADGVAEELYLSVLTRRPSAEERAAVAEYLAKNAGRRPAALGQLAWALLASTEFCVNH
jgi:hypothetical protein